MTDCVLHMLCVGRGGGGRVEMTEGRWDKMSAEEVREGGDERGGEEGGERR